MKERRPPVARNERKAITATAIRPCRWALGSGLISKVTSLVKRRSSSFPKGSVLCKRLIIARAAMFDGFCVCADQTWSFFINSSNTRTGKERENDPNMVSVSRGRSRRSLNRHQSNKISPLRYLIPRALPTNDQTGGERMKGDKGGKCKCGTGLLKLFSSNPGPQ